MEAAFNSYHNDPEYTSVILLSEAIRIMLKEIHPKRSKNNDNSRVAEHVMQESSDMKKLDNEGVKKMTSKTGIKGLSNILESSLLNESELQRAEIVFATNDIVMRLGKMIEDLSKMGTDDIMPLVDGIRDNFGPTIAEQFSREAEQSLQAAADSIDSMKQGMDAYRAKFEGHISDEDSQNPVDLSGVNSGGENAALGDIGDDGTEFDMPGIQGDEEFDDDSGLGDLGGDDDETSEPLGRSKKTMESKVGSIAVKEGYSKVSLGTRKNEDGEFVVKTWKDGKRYEGGDYFTNDWEDAKATEAKMKKSIGLKESKVVTIAGKKVKLTMEQIEILQKAKTLTEKIGGLGQSVISAVPATTFLNIQGSRIRITESQLKSLIFAKKFKERVDEKKANAVRLTGVQAAMLQEAKFLTSKVRELLQK